MTLQLRAHGLRQMLGRSLAKQVSHVHLLSPGTQHIGYFNDLGPTEIECCARRWSITMGPLPPIVDVLIVIGHGEDLSREIWRIKADRPELLVAIWLFDNHLAQLVNLRTISAADIYFPSHAFATDYLFNPWSIHGGHVPLCTAQWLPGDIEQVLAATTGETRRDQLLAAYVDYSFSSRSNFLRGMAAAVPGSDVKLMQPNDRSRFFGMSKQDQLREWCGYKTSVVVPFNCDLSTRLFDGMVCGHIVIVSDAVVDLDAVITPELQQELPVLRYVDGDYDSLRWAYALALGRYDAEGATGMFRRHYYVMRNHQMGSRVSTMLETLVRLDQNPAALVFDAGRGGLICMPTD